MPLLMMFSPFWAVCCNRTYRAAPKLITCSASLAIHTCVLQALQLSQTSGGDGATTGNDLDHDEVALHLAEENHIGEIGRDLNREIQFAHQITILVAAFMARVPQVDYTRGFEKERGIDLHDFSGQPAVRARAEEVQLWLTDFDGDFGAAALLFPGL